MSGFKVERGELKIDLQTFVEMLGKEERKALARQLVADEYLWRAVLECVADDSKYAGHYFRDDEDGEWWFSHQTVMELRERLIPLMPEIARLAVEEALRQRNQERADKNRVERWAWKMYHAWPEQYRHHRPDDPDKWTKGSEDVEAEAAELLKVQK